MILGRLQNRRGTSLIEILTTLVILVIGILSVARMFSGGFVVMKRSENITLASRLAEGEFERLRARAENLPLGITVASSPPPGTPSDAASPNIRQIVGETVRIPAPVLEARTTGRVIGSVHELLFSPVSSVDSVYSARLQRRILDSEDADSEPWRWLRPTQYAIDYDAARICFRAAPYDRTFSITYSYWIETEDERTLRTVTGENIVVPAGAGWLDITAGGIPVRNIEGFAGLDDRSDQASRAFRLLDTNAEWSADDPYQYKVVDSLTGRIAFNPRGHSYKESTPQGVVDLTAHVDYTVYDWGIISETLQVPPAPPYRLRTALRDIKQVGVTINDDGSPYTGLTPNHPEDLLVVDEATGQYIPSSVLSIDHRNGIIVVPEQLAIGSVLVPSAGRTLRVYYRCEGDWQVQYRKAYERYTPQNDSDVSYREYFHNRADGRIVLNRSEVGKSFSVDYVYLEEGRERLVTGEVVRAIASPNGERAWLIPSRVPEYVRAIRGLSFKVRVMWSESSRRDSEGRLVPRFQYFDLDGELTRRPAAGQG